MTRRRGPRVGGRTHRVFAVGALSVLFAVGSCSIADQGAFSEVGPDPTVAAPAVAGPAGVTIIDSLVADITRRPADLDVWVPSNDEARCAAELIVDEVGEQRLDSLGYRPDTPGSALTDLSLDPGEESAVVDAFRGCVDRQEMFAEMFFGSGRVPASVATCMAQGLENAGQLDPVLAAWALGRPVDPFAGDGSFASALSLQAGICVPEAAFNWAGLRLPDRNPVFDMTAPAGTTGSPFAGDRVDTEDTP